MDYKDKNIMQVGEGYFQSIIQAVTLGSIGFGYTDKNGKSYFINAMV